MAFTTPTQASGTSGNKELKLEKKDLEQEIGILGVQHEKTAKDLREIELRKSKIKDNKILCEKSEKEKNELKSTLAGLETKIKDREIKLVELEKQHSERVAGLNVEFLRMQVALEDKLDVIKDGISVASKKLSTIDTKKNKNQEEQNILVEKVKELRNEITILTEKSVKLEELIKDFPIKEKERKDLDDSITILQTLKTSLKGRTIKLHKEMTTIGNRVAKEKEEAEKFIKESKGIREKFDNEMSIQREKADKRDGSISEREVWLESKTEKLRGAKAELEKHYNRKLDHIVI